MITCISTSEGSLNSNVRCADVQSGHIVVDKSIRSLGLLKGGNASVLWGCLLIVDHGLYHRWAIVWVRNEKEYRELVRIIVGRATLYDTFVTNEELLHGADLEGYYSGDLRTGLKDMGNVIICNSINEEQVKYGYYARTKILPQKYNIKRTTEDFKIEQKMNVKDAELKAFIKEIKSKARARGDKYVNRIEYELGVTDEMGVTAYFVMVNKIIKKIYADGQYFSAGRGSVGGALISYLMGVSRFDPIADHHIQPMFERFINPHRVGLPDIDIDVPTDYRPSLIKHIAETMGKTYRISSVVTLGEKFCEDIAEQKGVDVEAYKKVNVGLAKNLSLHPAGLIITDDAIAHYKVDDVDICDCNMNTCDAFGLIKVDLLGLSNLDFIRNCVSDIDMEQKELDEMYDGEDLDVVKSMRGDTVGVFQFSSPKSISIVDVIQPSKYKHIVDLNVLMLAPFSASRAHERYRDAEALEDVGERFRETNGILLYQDQLLKYAVDQMGMPFSEADKLRRYISKASIYKEQLDEIIERYDDGSHGDVIDSFKMLAAYTWNVSHAMGYTRLTYINLYLRHYYPLIFYANLLNLEYDVPHIINRVMIELRRRKIKVKYATATDFSYKCVQRGDYILIGVSMIKGITQAKGDYLKEFVKTVDGYDGFIENVDKTKCNKAVTHKLLVWRFFDDARIDRRDEWNEAYYQLRIFRVMRFNTWVEGGMAKDEMCVLSVTHIARKHFWIVEVGNAYAQKVNFLSKQPTLKMGDLVRMVGGKIAQQRQYPRPFEYESDILPPPA